MKPLDRLIENLSMENCTYKIVFDDDCEVVSVQSIDGKADIHMKDGIMVYSMAYDANQVREIPVNVNVAMQLIQLRNNYKPPKLWEHIK